MMAAEISEKSVTHESWLISEAKARIKTDPFAAKSWILVARTIFPRSFAIQYEAYQMEKDAQSCKEMAKLLEEMLVNFPGEPQLWAEVQAITEALQSDSAAPKDRVLRGAFDALPAELQCHLLLRISETTSDVIRQSKLMLLVLKRYPHQVADQGVKLIDSLLSAEKLLPNPSPVNCYRKVLVCDVLPSVLPTAGRLPTKQLLHWLQEAIEFIVVYLAQSNEPSESGGYPRRVSIAGLSEAESSLADPWRHLFRILMLAAQHLGWVIPSDLFEGGRPWQQLSAMSQEPHPDPALHSKQVLFCAVILLLHNVHVYSSRAQASSLVLLDTFQEDVFGSPLSKRQRVEPPTLTSSVPDAQTLVDHFMLAARCWDLIHSSDTLQRDFQKMCQAWKSHTWPWLLSFEVDYLIYQGLFKDAAAKLRTLHRTPSSAIQHDVHAACCFFNLGNYARACEMALSVVSALPAAAKCTPLPPDPPRSRRLVSPNELLPYCLHLIIHCFQEKALRPLTSSDLALGHLLVLLQYEWPRYASLFCEVVAKIRQQPSFSYNLFFNYIINIEMLEEFADLRSQVHLDILPTSTRSLAQSRTMTRGVNKGVNEDFKVALEKQVARSNESVEGIIRTFLLEEQDLLKHSLT